MSKKHLDPCNSLLSAGKNEVAYSLSDFLVSYCLTFISLRSLGKLINPFII